MNQFMIGDFAFPCKQRSDATNEKDRKEEDMMWATFTIENLANHVPSYITANYKFETTWGWVLLLAKHVAKHFEVDEQELISEFFKYKFGLGTLPTNLVLNEMEKYKLERKIRS